MYRKIAFSFFCFCLITMISLTIKVKESCGDPAPDKCLSLSNEKKKLAEAIMNSYYLYDCCDRTVSKCLQAKKKCKLAFRIANEICSRVAKGQNKETIQTALDRRAKSMRTGAKTYQIDLSSLDTIAGDKDSPVTLVGYLCARCPFCSQIAPKIYRAVNEGGLKGKVKFYVRLFPIKSHPNSAEGAFAVAAAAKMGKFWPMLLKLYKNFDKFKPELILDWAQELGMDKKAFEAEFSSSAIKNIVIESKKEGLRNGVEGTPTFFINGKRYYGDHDMEYLLDALEEEYDRVTGNQ